MKLTIRRPPWYAAGLAFECLGCGRCCEGPAEGHVWATPDEIAAIAEHLGISEADMRPQYVREVGRRYSLTEQESSKDCIFLRRGGDGGRECAIYPVRPRQCWAWPFWRQNLSSPAAWAAAGRKCGGINRGPVFSLADIVRKLKGDRD